MNNNIRTLRGQLSGANPRRIIVDDGRPNYGYKVLEFAVWNTGTGASGVFGVLGTQYDMNPFADAGDNRQIAWAGSAWNTAGNDSNANRYSVIDPDHIVITDLYLRALAPGETMNYMIVVQPITMSDDEAILQLIKERSQDDTR